MNKKIYMTIAAVLVVGVTTFAAINPGLFTGNLFGLSGPGQYQSAGTYCIDFSSLDFQNLEISDDFVVSSGVVSEVTSEVTSDVPSIVTSQVTTDITTDVPSIVTSDVPSSVTSDVTSSVGTNVRCFTLKEKVIFYREITRDLKADIDNLVRKYKHFNTEYQNAVKELNATNKKPTTVKTPAVNSVSVPTTVKTNVIQESTSTSKPSINLKSSTQNAISQ